jgi:hypothetical protein
MSDSKKAYKNWKVQQGSDIIFPNQVWQAACDWKARAQDGGEPLFRQYYYKGKWHDFINNEHEELAISAGREVRSLYLHPPSSVVPDDSKHHAVMQAQMWAQEARTQKAIVKQIGEIVGCANDWEMVEAVKAALASAVVPEWIKCSAEIPNKELCVDLWASCIGGHSNGDQERIENCFRDHRLASWWKWNSKCTRKIVLDGFYVTHWMPRPLPPKQDQDPLN